MKLGYAKKKFKNEWIAFKFTDEAHDKGKVLIHSKSRHELHEKLRPLRVKKVYIAYAGPLVPKGYAILF